MVESRPPVSTSDCAEAADYRDMLLGSKADATDAQNDKYFAMIADGRCTLMIYGERVYVELIANQHAIIIYDGHRIVTLGRWLSNTD